jgi:hypothetical protein
MCDYNYRKVFFLIFVARMIKSLIDYS